MIWKLLVSALLSAALLAVIDSASRTQPTLLVSAIVIVALGYHRSVVSEAGQIAWGRLLLPRKAQAMIRYTVWGVPLGPARKVRVSAGAQNRSSNAPARAALLELLPAGIRWAVLRLSP